jgi:hypothetical protein
MGMQQETTNEVRADENAGAVAANENLIKVVNLSDAEDGFSVVAAKLADLKNASVANIIAGITDLESTVTRSLTA